jgi:hypothetical protein
MADDLRSLQQLLITNFGLSPSGYTGSTGAQGPAGSGFINLDMVGTVEPPFTGVARFYPPGNVAINTVYANLSSVPTGGNLNFVIKKNGNTVGNTFTMSSTLMTPVAVDFTITTADYITLDVTGGVATDLYVRLKYV